MVQEKATEFAGVMGVTDFQASGGWLESWLESCAFTSDIDFSSINKLESSLLKNSSQRQSSIRDFFV